MRAHLPALIALVSVSTYAACGSSDVRKVSQAGGAAGEGGVAAMGAGSPSTGGSLNAGAGAPSESAGQAGITGFGGASLGGMSDAGQAGLGASAGNDGASGAGQAGAPSEYALPAECPGVVGDYTLVVGTDQQDTFSELQQDGKALVFGLNGADVFDADYAGQDCLLGGPGDDVFTSSSEASSYFFGGPGDDTYHLTNDYNYFYLVDMEADDVVTLSLTAFDFLVGAPGNNPAADQILSLPGYSLGNASIPASQNAGAIVYDPDNGQLWADTDRGDKTSGATQIGTILDFASYVFDRYDFTLD